MSTQTTRAQNCCAECDQVWEDYIQAVTAHLGAVARRHKAILQKDLGVINEIAALESGLTQRELKARRAIDEHEAGHEPG